VSKYSAKFKAQVVRIYLNGEVSLEALAVMQGVGYSKLRQWVKLYRAHGAEGLSKKYSVYSADFKFSVLRRMWAEKLSCNEAAAAFNIRNPSCLPKWERLYRVGGVNALRPQRRGRAMAMKDPEGKPPPEPAERTREELIAELEQLRMENAYLKKLDALVRARHAPKERK
jgi:transposase